MIDAKADVNVKDTDGYTVLMVAAGDGHKEIVQLLLDAKADFNVQNEDGKTALMVAAERTSSRHEEIVQMLNDYAKAPELLYFLKSVSLEKYFAHLILCDYVTVADLKDASSEDLKECGIPPVSRKKLRTSIETYQESKRYPEL